MALVVRNPPASAGDSGSIPGSGRSPRGGCSNPLWCSGLEKPMDRGAWWATVCRVAELNTTEVTWHAHMHTCTQETSVVSVTVYLFKFLKKET